MELQVMSFNLRYWNEDDDQNAWPNRRRAVAKLIQESNAALVGTQEGLPSMLKDLDQSLQGYKRVGESRDTLGEGEFCAIYYRQELFDVLEVRQIWLSKTPDERGSKSWDSSLPRICTWARFRCKLDGQEIVFFNTHLDHMGEIARLEGAKLVLKHMLEYAKTPCLLTGDFNCTPNSAPIQLLETVLTNVLKKAGLGEKGTFHAFTGKATGAPIDYIFTSENVKVLSADVLDEPFTKGRYPSDHFPVTALLRI